MQQKIFLAKIFDLTRLETFKEIDKSKLNFNYINLNKDDIFEYEKNFYQFNRKIITNNIVYLDVIKLRDFNIPDNI